MFLKRFISFKKYICIDCLINFLNYFREVHKAKDRKSGNIVAIKKVLTDNISEGVSPLDFKSSLPF